MLTADEAAALAERVLAERYPKADAGFAAGSIVRGEATAGSDLDLVVLFPALPHARRECFTSEGTPVETFLHDPETLAWAFRDEAQLGRCAMTNMVAESRIVGPRVGVATRLQRGARRRLAQGPPPMTAARRDLLRYHITDRIGDLRDPRPAEELPALGVQLYDPISELILRGAGQWAGNGKWIPRRLRALDPKLAEAFIAAFDALYGRRDPAPLIALAERALAPNGGWLFDGYQSAWPATHRIARRRKRKG
jgi:hypothetical protein